MACSVNHVYVQADAHFLCAADFLAWFAYAILMLVRAGSPPAGPARGADKSATAAGGRGACHPQRQPDDAVPHADAR